MAPNASLHIVSLQQSTPRLEKGGYTFFGCRDHIHGVEGEQEEGRGEFVTKQPELANTISSHILKQVSNTSTYVKCIVFLELY